MNQTENTFLTQDNCDRCGADIPVRTTSWFTYETICMECSKEEQPIKQALRNEGFDDAMEGCGYIPSITPTFSQLAEQGTTKVEVVSLSNPFCWYRSRIGDTFDVFWYGFWGCYIVKNRIGRHPDDMKLRKNDVRVIDEELDN